MIVTEQPKAGNARVAYPASKDTRISTEDYQRGMHTTRGARPLRRKECIPEWANNDTKLRLVISQRVYSYVNYRFNALVPEDFVADLPSLKALSDTMTERMAAHPPVNGQQEQFQKHIDAVRRAGGYAPLIAAVAYRAYRLCEDSVLIAQGLGITPVCVRQHLNRLRRCARDLGLEGPSQHWSAKPRPPVTLVPKKVPKVRRTREERSLAMKASWVRRRLRAEQNGLRECKA
jgi:hypothetical protein